MSDHTTEELKRVVSERAETRSKLREAYQRIYNNPFRQSAISDPAVFRYEAARAYAKEFYKFTPRSLALPIAIAGSIVVLQILINRERAEKEREITSGEKTYFERARWNSRWAY